VTDNAPSWHTIAVASLPPGYRNVRFDGENLDHLVITPCPAILLQEDRTIRFPADRDEPRPTRTVFAAFDKAWPGSIGPASDTWPDYLGTVGPEQDPAYVVPPGRRHAGYPDGDNG
jgi:hypothetical protein